ncbi:MAG: hypothetical protein JO112_21800, partial [Planctomycetes bacterium]|nr:hypothetical protein [Planctomycetota bacterium]
MSGTVSIVSQRIFLTAILLTSLVGLSWAPAADEPALSERVVATLKGHQEMIYAVAFSPDGKYVATGSFDQTLKLWEAATGKEIKTFAGPAGHQKAILAVAFSPDGQSLASGSQDNTVKIWDLPSTSPLREFIQGAAIQGLALNPDA